MIMMMIKIYDIINIYLCVGHVVIFYDIQYARIRIDLDVMNFPLFCRIFDEVDKNFEGLEL